MAYTTVNMDSTENEAGASVEHPAIAAAGAAGAARRAAQRAAVLTIAALSTLMWVVMDAFAKACRVRHGSPLPVEAAEAVAFEPQAVDAAAVGVDATAIVPVAEPEEAVAAPALTNTVIGIGGGVGPAAGVYLHGHVVRNTNTNGKGDHGHLDVLHVSRGAAVTDRSEFLLGKVAENPGEGMAKVVHGIAAAAAATNARAVVGVPCNTFHSAPIWNKFQTLVAEQSPNVHLVHMVDETVKYVREIAPKARTIGMLCTTGTRQSGLYDNAMGPHGFNMLYVPKDLQEQVHNAIYSPVYGVKACGPTSQACAEFKRFATMLIEQGADVVILGCTEIPLALTGSTFTVEVGASTVGATKAGATEAPAERDPNASDSEEECAADGEAAATKPPVEVHIPLVDPMVALARALIREVEPSKLVPLPTVA